jgi:hypothetical protein
MAERLKDEDVVREVNEVQISDNNDFLGELEDEFFQLSSDNEFLQS